MDLDRKIATASAGIYIAASVTVSAAFLVAATMLKYNDVARIGGAVWVLLLSLIVTMPIVTAQAKKRMQAGSSNKLTEG